MQRYGDMLTEQQRSVAVRLLSRSPPHFPAALCVRLSVHLHEETCLSCNSVEAVLLREQPAIGPHCTSSPPVLQEVEAEMTQAVKRFGNVENSLRGGLKFYSDIRVRDPCKADQPVQSSSEIKVQSVPRQC